MPLDLRSSPQEVVAFFATPRADGELADALHILRNDPNWHVQATSSPTAWDLKLLYRPAGAPSLTLRLEQVEAHTGTRVWRAMP